MGGIRLKSDEEIRALLEAQGNSEALEALEVLEQKEDESDVN